MTDESTTPASELASAALDNEITALERAQVDASAALLSERDFYAEMRATLRTIEPSAAGRESTIAAALAVFDDLQKPVIASTNAAVAPVVSLQSRRERHYRWLGGIAAAAAFAVVGVAVLNQAGGNNENKASLATDARASGSPLAVDEAQPAADKAGQDASVTEMAAETTVASATGAYSTAADAGAQAGSAMPLPAAVDAIPRFTDRDDVIVYVTNAREGAPPIDQSTDSFAPCIFDVTLPGFRAVYRGLPVIVRVDDAAGVIEVVDEPTCEHVESIPLP